VRSRHLFLLNPILIELQSGYVSLRRENGINGFGFEDLYRDWNNERGTSQLLFSKVKDTFQFLRSTNTDG
jgi:hypothetical protein